MNHLKAEKHNTSNMSTKLLPKYSFISERRFLRVSMYYKNDDGDLRLLFSNSGPFVKQQRPTRLVIKLIYNFVNSLLRVFNLFHLYTSRERMANTEKSSKEVIL